MNQEKLNYYKKTDVKIGEDVDYIYYRRTAFGGDRTFPKGFEFEIKWKKSILYKLKQFLFRGKEQ